MIAMRYRESSLKRDTGRGDTDPFPRRSYRLPLALAAIGIVASACSPYSATHKSGQVIASPRTTTRPPTAAATHRPPPRPKPTEPTPAQQYAAADSYLRHSEAELPVKIVLPKTITTPAIRTITIEAENYQIADQLTNTAVTTPVEQAASLLPGIGFITDSVLQRETQEGVALGLEWQYESGLSGGQADNLGSLEVTLQGLLGPNSPTYTQVAEQLGKLQVVGTTYIDDIVDGQDYTAAKAQLDQAANAVYTNAKQANDELDTTYHSLRATVEGHIPNYHDPAYGP